MQQVAEWLKKLGLVQYAQRFAENDINFAVLADLTDQDLKELGVSSLSHRRQLLRAMGKSRTTSAVNLASLSSGIVLRWPAVACQQQSSGNTRNIHLNKQ